MKQNTRLKLEHDVARILRKNRYVVREAAIELWRQDVSTLDIALAPCLSEVQRLDLIEAVDRLVNRANLSNRKEKIMRIPGTKMDRSCGPEGTVTEGDGGGEHGADPDIAALNADNPEGDVGDLKAAFEHPSVEEVGAAIDKQIASEEDTARLHVALKDPPVRGEVLDNGREMGGDCEEGVGSININDARQADLDQCCGTDPLNDVADEAAKIHEGLPDQFVPDFPKDAPEDPDRERLTGVDYILNEKEKKESPASRLAAAADHLYDPVRKRIGDLVRNRDYWAGIYSDLKKDYDRLKNPTFQPDQELELHLKEQDKPSCCSRPIVREEVYKLIDGERDYQDNSSYTYAADDKSNWTLHDWLVSIETRVCGARDITGNPDFQMAKIREIAGYAVAAMEHILAPARV